MRPLARLVQRKNQRPVLSKASQALRLVGLVKSVEYVVGSRGGGALLDAATGRLADEPAEDKAVANDCEKSRHDALR
jgi:hypothetical protein